MDSSEIRLRRNGGLRCPSVGGEAVSFTDGKPWTVTEEDLKAPWSGGKSGKYFRCYLCGHRFKLGDIARWQYTNDVPGAGGNPLVCRRCDGTKAEIALKWISMKKEAEGRMWYFTRPS
jgi:hypothetical protein